MKTLKLQLVKIMLSVLLLFGFQYQDKTHIYDLPQEEPTKVKVYLQRTRIIGSGKHLLIK